MERQSVIFAANSSDYTLLVLQLPGELTASGDGIQTFAVPLISRRKGMMLALPIGLLKESLLSSTETVDEGDLIGPAQTFEVERPVPSRFWK